MGRRLFVILKTQKSIKEAREICKGFFLSHEYEVLAEAPELLVLRGGDFFWTVLGTYRWDKVVKTLIVNFEERGGSTDVKLHYDVSRLGSILSPLKSAKHEIETLQKKLEAELVELNERR
ncbi:MAG: hypothetical protein QXT84_06325 [Candidatus Bathyarchaeia archaeon]